MDYPRLHIYLSLPLALPSCSLVLAKWPAAYVELGTSDVIAGLSSAAAGRTAPKSLYFFGRQPVEFNPEAKDVANQRLLWKDTVGYTRLREGETVLRNFTL